MTVVLKMNLCTKTTGQKEKTSFYLSLNLYLKFPFNFLRFRWTGRTAKGTSLPSGADCFGHNDAWCVEGTLLKPVVPPTVAIGIQLYLAYCFIFPNIAVM